MNPSFERSEERFIRHFVSRFLVKNYEKRREGETDENGRDPVQVP